MASPTTHVTPIPTRWIGPLRISGNTLEEEISVPLATYEFPLWPSCGRGAKLSRMVEEGIRVTVVDACMTRSILLTAADAGVAYQAVARILAEREALQQVVSTSSRFARLRDIHHEIVGNLLFLRFSFDSADASGHNMASKAADALIRHLLAVHPELSYGSISANYCIDKKPGAINAILGRGTNVVAEILLPAALCSRHLRTTAAKIVALHVAKNLIGSTLSGAIRSANAHFANMLLAFYLATGQDAANLVEGAQGIVHAQDRDGDLYFSCTLPNLIVGTVGNGKGGALTVVEEHLKTLGCRQTRARGANARRLAAICAAIVLCGELSLLAAQTNPGELMRAHLAMERG